MNDKANSPAQTPAPCAGAERRMTARGATMTGKRSPLPPIQGTKQSEI
ncbi:MAG: hypothetical protein IKN11_05225 [Bacteroidales bacterium]|nr:hypothetical protein [Bacteroidales bacterium]